MKRGSGRPARITSDIELVWYVRHRKTHGDTVEEACRRGFKEGYLKPRSGLDDPIGALKRRYDRVASAYPDKKVKTTIKVLGMPIKGKARVTVGAALISVYRSKPIK